MCCVRAGQVLFDANLTYNEEKEKFEFAAGQLKTAEECVLAYHELATKYVITCPPFVKMAPTVVL